jgi:cytochrome c-type biogenesis protein
MNEVSLLAAGVTATAAGVLSFLSPCVLPLMPAYLSFVSGISLGDLRRPEEAEVAEVARRRRRRVLIGSISFVGGFSSVFVAIGASATAIGRVVSGVRLHLFGFTIAPAQIAGVLIVIFGLHLIGLLRIPWLYNERRFSVEGGGSGLQAYVLGAAFAFGWTPCIGPVLAGILTLAAGQETVGRGVVLLLLYSLGLGIPFLLMAVSLDRFYEAFERLKRHFRAIEVVSGLMLIGVGLLVATDRLVALNAYFGFLNDFVLQLEELLL